MKKFSSLVIFLALLLSATPGFTADEAAKPAAGEAQAYTAKSPVLTRAQFDALLANPKEVVVIDVRRPDELTAKGGFPVYLSIQSKDLEKYLDFIPKDRTIITVSNHAGRAGKSADLLTEKGFKVAGAIGVEGYEAEGGTLTRLAPPPPKP
jgi:rhodanese-related sulfurtransferase